MKHSANFLETIKLERDADEDIVRTQESVFITDSLRDFPALSQGTQRAAVELNADFFKPTQDVYSANDLLDPLPLTDDSVVDFPPGYVDDFGQGTVYYDESGSDDSSTTAADTFSSAAFDQFEEDDYEPIPMESVCTSELLNELDQTLGNQEWEFPQQEEFPQPEESFEASSYPMSLESIQGPTISQAVVNCGPCPSVATRKAGPTTVRSAAVLSQKKKKTVPVSRKSKAKHPAPKRRNRVRKVYDIAPEKRVYKTFNAQLDVALGRGGKTNKNPGNLKMHKYKLTMQAKYHSVPKDERTHIAQELVAMVEADGGNFVQKDNVGWYIVDNHIARTKAGQALRERYTQEERAEKRARYRLKKKTQAKKSTKASRGQ